MDSIELLEKIRKIKGVKLELIKGPGQARFISVVFRDRDEEWVWLYNEGLLFVPEFIRFDLFIVAVAELKKTFPVYNIYLYRKDYDYLTGLIHLKDALKEFLARNKVRILPLPGNTIQVRG